MKIIDAKKIDAKKKKKKNKDGKEQGRTEGIVKA